MNALMALSDSSWKVHVPTLLDDRSWWRRLIGDTPPVRALTAAALVRALVAVASRVGDSDQRGREGFRVVVAYTDQRRLRADERGVQVLLGELLGIDGPVRVQLVPDLAGALSPGEIHVRVVRGMVASSDDPARTLLAGERCPAVAPPRPSGPPALDAGRTLGVLDPWDVPEPQAVQRVGLVVHVNGRLLGKVGEGQVVTLGRGGDAGPERWVLGATDTRVSRTHITLTFSGGTGEPPKVQVARPMAANPVMVGAERLERGATCAATLPTTIDLSHGAVMLTVERCLL